MDQCLTHIEEALAHLVTQFKEKDNVSSLIETFCTPVQDLEGVFFDIVASRNFTTSTGAQVDGFGSIVGEAREGRNDLDYKTAIRGRMILNYSKGTIEEIIALIQNIAGDVVDSYSGLLRPVRVQILELFPAGFFALILDPIDPAYVNPAKIAGIMHSGRPAGVYGFVTYGTIGSFRYDSGPGYDVGKYGGGSE